MDSYLFVWIAWFGIRTVTEARQNNSMSLLFILSGRSNVLANEQGMCAQVYIEVEHIWISYQQKEIQHF
jgi:hypothetical protein